MLADIARWEVRYEESRDSDLLLLDRLRERAASDPERTAIQFGKVALSWEQLASESRSLSAALVDLSVKSGDRIALVLPRCPQAIISLFAIWGAGAIAVPIDPHLTERELELAITESGSSLAIVLVPFYAKLKAIQVRAAVRRIIVTSVSEYLPPLTRFLHTFLVERKTTPITGDLWLPQLIEDHTLSLWPMLKIAQDDAALVLPAHELTHHSIAASGIQLDDWFTSATR